VSGWEVVGYPSAIQEETHTYVSSPRSLLTTAGLDAGLYAMVQRYFAGTLHEAHFEVAIRTGNLDAGSPWGSAPMGLVSWTTDTSEDAGPPLPIQCSYVLEVTTGSAQLNVQSSSSTGANAYPLLRYPIVGQWGRWNIDLTSDSNGIVTVTMQLDGAKALGATQIPTCQMGGPVTFLPGLFDYPPLAEVRFDNVRVDVK
jgi:hypothetical protein